MRAFKGEILRLRVAAIGFGLAILVLAPSALASNVHWSSIHTTSADNGLSTCSWRGYHEWSSALDYVEAVTYGTGGDCVDYHVRYWYNGGILYQDYDPWYAIAVADYGGYRPWIL